MRIKLRGYMKFRGFLGDGISLELKAEETTLRHALEAACERCGDGLRNAVFDSATGNIKKPNLILLNGQPCANPTNLLGSVLKDGDEIVLATLVSGG